ncbi:MAG TPA: permease-like cell division protein FtsX [Patescibacteria group bacterium]|nr:permease-like cell division protein FtsX [Patescibacteria group bacterium]
MHWSTMWNHIRRSPYQALAAILIMMLTFLAVSVFTILVAGSNGVISYFESKPQVTAFFKDEATQDQITTLENSLKASGSVSSMKFVSKNDALKIYREQNKNDPLLLELVTADVLPASLEISATNITDLSSISTYLQKDQSVQEVVYQKDVVAALTTWTNAVKIIGVLLIALLSIVSIFIMSIIVGLKISHKKDEIEIMQLIGATKWYISNPFVLEGIFYGVVGAFFGWFVSSAVLLATTPLLETFLKGIPVLPAPWWFYVGMLLGELVLAVILGIFSSLLAVMRYIK